MVCDTATVVARAAADAAARLTAAEVSPDALGRFVPARRRLFGTRPPRIERVGSAWVVGRLLVSVTGELFAATHTLRAHVPKPHINYPSESARERDQLRHAAIRGGFREGETVHWDAVPIIASELTDTSVPVLVRDGMPMVIWSASAPAASAQPLPVYLDTRIELLLSVRS